MYNLPDTDHRGFCLIVLNNGVYSRFVDVLRNYFNGANYDVDVRYNINLQGEDIEKISKQTFTSHVCFVCFIFDTEKVNGDLDMLQYVIDSFTPAKVPSLDGKPKLFFFQRLSQLDTGYVSK
uniref:uncharacterized protein LOC120340055 n=1 Tax=Styela clava TaxID=7725 RepID=UPI001939722F|nr:uncharacterized protein LOC120340055 [Styela clava]